MTDLKELVRDFEQALLNLDRLKVQKMVMELDDSWVPIQRVERLIAPALERIGSGWEQGKVSLSQVYMSGRVCEELVDTWLPSIAAGRKNQPRMAIAVLNDYHMLGKRIVYSVLRADGFDLLDYGRVETEDLVRKVQEDDVDLMLISTLMLPSALSVKDVKARLNGTDSDIKIVVGGAPFRFDSQLWRDVGADAMARNASEIGEIIFRLTGGQS
jgi:methanogenic corrinoid protein MtbC1